jgi:hypothetical protein
VRKKMQKENKLLLTLAALASVPGFFWDSDPLRQSSPGLWDRKKPPGIEATLEYVTDQLGFTPPLSDFLFDDPGNVLLQDVTVDGLLSRYRAFIG